MSFPTEPESGKVGPAQVQFETVKSGKRFTTRCVSIVCIPGGG